jgi:peptidylprolyl isomerase
LGGNRTIAEPLEFKYGRLPGELNKPLMRKSVVGIGAEVKYPRLKIITFYSSLFT